ncbi:short-chain dehydrogenase [Tricladium varicosporioides]|nr:short-chain dehydrogenase [Hymenoscyphus varicosporioides]
MFNSSLSSRLTQMFPPKPDFTEKSLPNLQGKVYIVTGSNTGVGKELAQILYCKNATVYIGARSEDKAFAAIDSIKNHFPKSTGNLVFLHLDLSDLTTIKASAEEFLSKEKQLHVLFNNAGVMMPPQGSKSAQGYELQLGVNNIGTFMLTKLLTPLLISTAKKSPLNTVRVIWLSSSATELFSPKSAGVDMENLDYHREQSPMTKYAHSKAGNYLHAVEFSNRFGADGILSLAVNPGNLQTELVRHQSRVMKLLLRMVQYKPIFGAYTELFAGLSPEVKTENGHWIIPWGRYLDIRKDLIDATKTEAEGGTGVGLKFWEWNEAQIQPYL